MGRRRHYQQPLQARFSLRVYSYFLSHLGPISWSFKRWEMRERSAVSKLLRRQLGNDDEGETRENFWVDPLVDRWVVQQIADKSA